MLYCIEMLGLFSSVIGRSDDALECMLTFSCAAFDRRGLGCSNNDVDAS